MSDELPAFNDSDGDFLTPFTIAIRDSIDRSDIWMDVAKDLLKLGWLCEALRGPERLHPHIADAVRVCMDASKAETDRAERFMGVYRKHLNVEAAKDESPAQKD